MKQVLVNAVVIGLLVGAHCSALGSSALLVDVSVAPTWTSADPWPTYTGTVVAAQCTWVRSRERTSSISGVVRYMNGLFEPSPPVWVTPDVVRHRARGNPDVVRAHFVEAGLGLRSSSGLGAAVWFGEFEGGGALIGYQDHEGSQTTASPFVGLRFGTAGPSRSALQLALAAGVRLYPAAEYITAYASFGVAYVPWHTERSLAPAPN